MSDHSVTVAHPVATNSACGEASLAPRYPSPRRRGWREGLGVGRCVSTATSPARSAPSCSRRSRGAAARGRVSRARPAGGAALLKLSIAHMREV